MKYVAILDSLDELSEEAIEHMKNVVFSGGDEQVPWCFDITSIKEGPKALEQEPILDKIRTEIENLEEGISSYHNDRPLVYKDEVLQIIDKYKAETRREG